MRILLPILATLSAATPLSAQQERPAAPPAQDREFLSLYMADGETLFSDPKDRGLLAALRMIDDRVLELPYEIPGCPALSPAVIQLVTRVIVGEKSLRVGLFGEPGPGVPFPVYGQVTIHGDSPAAAAELNEWFAGLIRMGGMPLAGPGENGLTAIPVPAPVPIWFGPKGSSFIVAAGKVLDTPLDLSNTGLPDGAALGAALYFDYGAYGRLLSQGMAMSGEGDGAAEMLAIWDTFGLTDLRIHLAMGADAERSYTVVRMPGYAASMRRSGMWPTRALRAADVKLVPADATWAAVAAINLRGTADALLDMFEEQFAEQGIGDPVEMLHGMTGFHLHADVLDNLGSTWGLYASDSTGGGGLLSVVAFVELSNPERLHATHERIEDMIDGLGQMEANGYVRVKNWEHGGTRYSTLTFPGLPIPLEPTVAMTGHHLFVGLTAQAAMAGVAQATSGETSLLDNPRFREQLAGEVDGAYSLSFFDSPRLLRDGYGLTSLLCSALANGTRSRSDASRDAGLIMPSFHALARGAKASVTVTRVDGDDYVSESRGDRSILVNVTSLCGFMAATPLVFALPPLFLAGAAAQTESFEAIALEPSEFEVK